MRSYVVTTGAIAVLLVLAHLARIFVEGTRLLSEPDFVLATVASVGIGGWALVLLRKPGGRSP
jgi:hypothetical protein